MTHLLLLRCLSEKPIWYIYMVIRHKSWLYAPLRSNTTYESTSYQEKPRGGYVSTTVVIRLISWLCVVIYHICIKKMPEPSDDGFIWLYGQRRGYTLQFVVIRLVLLMRQHLTSKTQPRRRHPGAAASGACRLTLFHLHLFFPRHLSLPGHCHAHRHSERA